MQRTNRSQRGWRGFGPRPLTGAALSALIAALGASGLLAAPTVAQESAPAATPAEVARAVEPYLIGPGDRLALFVWKEPDLTRELLVRTDGMVTVPLIGDVRAAATTTADLAATIEERLGRFVNSPSVSVGLTNAHSAQFYIVGRVARPGAYPIDKPTSFLQALALAGGFVEFAKTDRVLVFREGGSEILRVDYKKLEDGDEPAQNILLQVGDTIVVP